MTAMHGHTEAAGPGPLRRLVAAWLLVVAALLALFVAVEVVGGPTALDDPEAALHGVSAFTALLGVGLLVVDAVVPVASSGVMIVLGAAFGAVGGAVLATLGSMGALAVGAGIGRSGRRRMATFLDSGSPRVRALVDRYGIFAVVVSRPVPLLAESVAIVAAASGMALPRLLLAGLAGTVPVAVVLATVGDRGGQGEGVAAATVLIVLALGSVAVAVLRRRKDAAGPR